MRPSIFYSHTLPGRPPSEWEVLEEHLRQVAERASEFACAFGAAEWGHLAGLWHDLGKYRRSFQEYLHQAGSAGVEATQEQVVGRVDHSTAGALFAVEALGPFGKVLAYVIAGHHAGLPDGLGGQSALESRLMKSEVMLDLDLPSVPEEILRFAAPVGGPPSRRAEEVHLWVRLLFSCLVDADSLATEAFTDPEKALLRTRYPTPDELFSQLARHMETKFGEPRTEVHRIRQEVLRACVDQAKCPPGIFSLTVPTGGGKTLSSLAFALRHASLHGQRRVVYAIPYTSIIEQTAKTFREIFGEWVLEHHSNLDPDDPARETVKSALAAENWDAPIVVTTNVQLFESLFSARRSRCRKLHRLVGSVIVLDEAQLLPPEFLAPILDVLRAMVRDYGVTVVISTATQPALDLGEVRELAPDPAALDRRLRRVRYEWPESNQPQTWEEIAEKVMAHSQALCVVNRRDDARHLVSLLPEEAIHLSALMCGEHRSRTIARIKRRLAGGQPVRVVSTQLVEAGVDLDFPAVFRAFAGLDSIAQAAGRCNREGRLQLPELGRVVVFHPPKGPPRGLLRMAADTTAELLFGQAPEALEPELFNRYFDLLYRTKVDDLDRHGILGLLGKNARDLDIQFREAGDRFRLIEESGYQPVLVGWEKGADLLREFRHREPDRGLFRRAQRFVVTLPPWQLAPLQKLGAVAEIAPGLFGQMDDRLYDERLGLLTTVPEYRPEELVV